MMVALTTGDTVELQVHLRVADGNFAADQPSFWGLMAARLRARVALRRVVESYCRNAILPR